MSPVLVRENADPRQEVPFPPQDRRGGKKELLSNQKPPEAGGCSYEVWESILTAKFSAIGVHFK